MSGGLLVIPSVPGSGCVAEKMLQDYFGLQWPKWLDHKYYLGW